MSFIFLRFRGIARDAIYRRWLNAALHKNEALITRYQSTNLRQAVNREICWNLLFTCSSFIVFDQQIRGTMSFSSFKRWFSLRRWKSEPTVRKKSSTKSVRRGSALWTSRKVCLQCMYFWLQEFPDYPPAPGWRCARRRAGLCRACRSWRNVYLTPLDDYVSTHLFHLSAQYLKGKGKVGLFSAQRIMQKVGYMQLYSAVYTTHIFSFYHLFNFLCNSCASTVVRVRSSCQIHIG